MPTHEKQIIEWEAKREEYERTLEQEKIKLNAYSLVLDMVREAISVVDQDVEKTTIDEVVQQWEDEDMRAYLSDDGWMDCTSLLSWLLKQGWRISNTDGRLLVHNHEAQKRS